MTGWGSFNANALISSLGLPAPSNVPVTGLTAYSVGVTSIVWNWTALAGDAYNIYYASNPSQSIVSGIRPPFTQSGLVGNTATGIIVYSEFQGVQGTVSDESTVVTLALPPGAGPVMTTAYSSSATFTYSACSPSSACSGYEVQASVNSNFSSPVFSSTSLNSSFTPLTVSGLSPNTGYFMRLAYQNSAGVPSFGPSGATFNTGTNLVAPAFVALAPTGPGAITFNWGQSTNPAPPNVTYVAQASPAANFSGTLYTQTGTALSAAFNGLSADTSYYFEVQGVGGPYLYAGPVATLAAAPAVPAAPFPSVDAGGFTLAWSSNGNQPDSLYQAAISPSATFSSGVISTSE